MSFILNEKHKMIENDSFVLDVGIEEIRKWCNDNGVNPEEFLGTSFGVALQAFNCLEYATFNVIKTDSDGYYDKVQQITFEVSVEKRIKEIIEGLKIHDVVENESDVLYVYQGENYQQDIKHCSRDKKDASENLFGISQAYIIGIEEDKIIIKSEWDSVRSSSYIINRFVKMYDRILLELTRKETIGDIELVSEEDKKDILTLHDTEFTVTEKPAYRLLQDSAEKNPDKVALVAVDRTLTYRELNEEANAVGHALIAEARKVRTGLIADSGHGPDVTFVGSLVHDTSCVPGESAVTGARCGGLSTGTGDGSEGSYGLAPDTIVAVMADRDSYAYVMRDGVLKAGGAFLPIDPEYPEERIRFILEDSKARMIVTTGAVIERRKDLISALQAEGIRVIDAVKVVAESLVGTCNKDDVTVSSRDSELNGTKTEEVEGVSCSDADMMSADISDTSDVRVSEITESTISDSRKNLNIDVPYDALAYVIYTSGSTGKPKGVMLTNKNLVNFVDADPKNREILGYTEKGSVSLAIAALTFDFAIMEEYVPIANGMTVVLATQEQILNPDKLTKLMLDNRVDVMSCTPGYLGNLISIDSFLPAVKGLKSVDFGAEAFPPSLFGKLKDINPDLYIMNGYGPTEATISCTMEVIDKAEDITIGIPNVNVHVATVDREGHLQPLGAMGELVIMGDGVGRGYIGREDLNKKNFIKLLGMPAYRSGDLVRIREDRNIEFHGRIDNQVKLRGLRVELGEIESVMATYPSIRTAVVIVAHGETDYLAAYFTADEKVDIEKLKEHISQYLTAYMVPQAFMQLDSMPMTANGKVDKKALPVIEVTIEEIVPAENEMQEKILDIAKEVIGTEKTGITTDLFMVGLSSIGCIKLCSLLSDAFDVNIKVAEIFECKNVKSIEALVNEKRDSGENTVSYELRESYPLTKTQMGIYVDSEVYEGTTVYNIPILYSLDPNVDLERLRDAIIKTFLAHPYLFMTLCDENGVIRAVRNQPEVFDIQIKDVMPELDDLVYPFDLTAGKRLFRVELFDTAKGKYFFVDIHHIVFDGWSLSVLRDDINRAYSGENVPVEKYTGYEAALDEEVALKTDRHGKAKAFYDSVFLGCGGETMPVKDGKFTESKIEYSEYTGEKNADEVRDCCIKNGVSLNAFFTAAFGMALQTYTASEEVIFSTIYNGRNDSRVENSISMFVKTMPVRLEFIAEDSVRDTLKKCQNYLLSAMANDIYSFAEISKAYGIGADILFAFQGEESGSMTIGGYPSKEIELPLSQTMAPFDVDVYLIGNKIVYKAAIDPNVYSSYTINGFLKLFDRIVSGFIEKETIGDIELVSEEDKKDILNLHDTKFTVKEKPAYRLLQDSAEKNPDKVALVAVDRTLIYRELNEEANAVGHALIAEARKVRTGLIADSGHGPDVTFAGSLVHDTSCVPGESAVTGARCGGLSTGTGDGSEGSYGLAPDTIVAVMADRDSYAYVMRDGVLKAGGAFLPIDPEYPEERIRFILEDSKARMIVTTGAVIERRKDLISALQAEGIRVIDAVKVVAESLAGTCNKDDVTVSSRDSELNGTKTEEVEGVSCSDADMMSADISDTSDVRVSEITESTISDSRKNLNIDVPYDALAYVIYTSGSTGKPKGVMLTNKNLVNFVDADPKNREILGYTEKGSVSLAIAALTFDFAIMEEYVPIANGMTVVLATQEQILNPDKLTKLMLDNRVDVMSCTPGYLGNLISIDSFLPAVKGLKSVDFGAEAFPPSLFGKLKDINPDLYIMNGYGPTETTISCTMEVIDKAEDITIGIPNVNVHVATVDREGHLQPLGAMGELVIMGDGVGRGYIGREDINKKNFIKLLGMPAYRSGDLVRIREDRNIEFHGRIDNQVKLRGLRVELGEIESVMATYPSIRTAVVIVAHGETDYLAAYFTADEKVDIEKLKEHISQYLTAYMVPQAFMQLDSMPMTANGKVDKKALPVIEVTIEEIVPAENEMQEKILDIAKEVIGTDKIGITTDLFAAGLSSLSSIRMSSLLKDRVDANISIAELFDNRTVRSIEALISGKAPEEEFEIRSEYPLSMTQMGIFVESVKYSGTTVYNIPYLYKLDECVDMDKLDEALSKAVEAHPYLSMTMKQSDDGNIIAIRNKKDRVAISVSDTKPVLDDLVEPFDLTDGTPLYRIELFDTADGKYLFVDFHHIIMDGESFEIFLQDVNKAYLGQTLKAEQFTGFEYALSEEKKRNSNAYEAAKDFYDSVFKGCEPCTLPVKENKTSGGHIASDSRTGATSAESIREYCSKQNISENAFFTVAFGLALKAYTSSEEAIFTTIYNGRNDPRLSDSVGMFVKTFPVMLRSNEGDKITDVLSACSQYLIGAMSHDIFSFNEISNRYGIRSDVIFAYQGDSNGDKELVIGGFAVSETEEQDLSQAKASIDMNVMLDGDKIEYEYEYDPEMYSSYTLDGLVGMMDRIVSELIVRDKIGDISLVIEEDKQKIISLHDSFYAVKERPAYRLLQDSAEENPDKVALVAVDRTLTYKELNEEANAVGHALIAEARKIHADSFGAFGHESAVMMDDSLARYTGGVSGDRIATGGVVGGLSTEPCDGSEGSHGLAPDTIVAVMADRDSYAYVMRDGVLKAGGAFLPIDPEYPEERIRFILEDSKARMIVTTGAVIERRKELISALQAEGIRVIDAVKVVAESLVGTCNKDDVTLSSRDSELNGTKTEEVEGVSCSDADLMPADISDTSDVRVSEITESTISDPRKNLNIDVPYDALAYVIYTSGSTGKPKGVMLTNKNLVNFVDADPKNREILGYTEKGSVSLAIAALTFDFAIMEEYVPIANGMTVVLATQEQILNPDKLTKLMLDNRVDVMSCTPGYLGNLISIDSFLPAVKGLKSVDFGAEAFPPSLFGKLKDINPDLYIMNGYGPTETTISCTMEVIDKAEDITIGIPNVNVHVATVDREGHLQPLGAMGELVIMGDGVGRGYIGREDLNKKNFIKLLGMPAYRSGDLVRIREDRNIEFHGRIDNQVKLRGLRVELGEIESVMATYPSIRTAVVIVAHGETDYLAAYFTADEKVDIEKLKEHISQYLTAYMVPQALMQLDRMPMTANGKVDKKALPEINKVISNKIIKQPENELQKRLCGLFSKALNMEVGIDDDFFEMGGTSLTAAKVLMGAKVQNIPMEYQDIFDARTVEKLDLILRHRDGVNVEYESAQHDDKNDERAEAEKVSGHRTYENPEIEKVLAHNTREFVAGIKPGSLGNVLLTGATGFMGIHVLKEIIDHSNCRIICLVNGKKKGNAYISGESRLRLQLFYYFDNAYEELFGNRIFVKESDITDSEAIAALEGEYFDTVINCAASVKHFADFNFLRQVNVDGVENLIKLCIRKKARLIHLSTSSVCGEAVDGVSSEDVFKECSLNIGQDVTSNAYVHTKYLAEEKVLKAVAEQGLDGKIMRLGNLMSRQEDGEFQINFRTNNFMNTLRAYAVLGCIPYSELDDQTDFSPIDETARAVVHLAGTPSDFTIFHVYNSHEVDMADVVAAMDLCGLHLDAVTDEAFAQRLREGLADDDINAFLSPLINYDLTDDNRRQDIACDNRFTVQALGRLGIRWSITDMEYLEKVIEMLQTLGFFDIK